MAGSTTSVRAMRRRSQVSNDAWGGCNCDQCASDRAAVARVLGTPEPKGTTQNPDSANREGE